MDVPALLTEHFGPNWWDSEPDAPALRVVLDRLRQLDGVPSVEAAADLLIASWWGALLMARSRIDPDPTTDRITKLVERALRENGIPDYTLDRTRGTVLAQILRDRASG